MEGIEEQYRYRSYTSPLMKLRKITIQSLAKLASPLILQCTKVVLLICQAISPIRLAISDSVRNVTRGIAPLPQLTFVK